MRLLKKLVVPTREFRQHQWIMLAVTSLLLGALGATHIQMTPPETRASLRVPAPDHEAGAACSAITHTHPEVPENCIFIGWTWVGGQRYCLYRCPDGSIIGVQCDP